MVRDTCDTFPRPVVLSLARIRKNWGCGDGVFGERESGKRIPAASYGAVVHRTGRVGGCCDAGANHAAGGGLRYSEVALCGNGNVLERIREHDEGERDLHSGIGQALMKGRLVG